MNSCGIKLSRTFVAQIVVAVFPFSELVIFPICFGPFCATVLFWQFSAQCLFLSHRLYQFRLKGTVIS